MQSLTQELEVKVHNPTLLVLKEFWSFFVLNRGAVIGLGLMILFLFAAVFSPVLAPHSPDQVFSETLRAPPFWLAGSDSRFLLGTDDVGRDVLSRLLAGSTLSLGIGFFIVILSTLFGTLIGLISGYFGGFIDQIIMRLTDILMALPRMLLAIVVVTILGPGLVNAVIAVVIGSLPGFIRIVRASVLQEKPKPHVIASRSFGASHSRLIFISIFPNTVAPLIVQSTLTFSDGILNVAALGFLGLGAQPPTAEWGTMLADSRAYIETSPWMVTLPGLCILITVLAFNLLGDGLRDAFDPKMKR